ncbi:sulfotransferase [Xanthomonas maliensis]|nr:sulfotransferase [Xanthomonas maliensis]
MADDEKEHRVTLTAVDLRPGYQLLRQRRYADATALAEALVRRAPQDPQVLEFASEAQLANGDAEAALAHIGAAVAAATTPLALLIKQASLLLQLRRRQQAKAVARQAATLAANDGAAWWRIGALYSGCQDVVAARDAYRQAVSLLGEQPSLLYDLATMEFFSGAFEAAEQSLQRVLQQAPDAGDALYLRATLRRQTAQRHHLDDLRQRLAQGLADPAARAAGLYALAKELEDLERHDASFAALTAAADCKRKTLRYDVEAECTQIARIRAVYDRQALDNLQPGDGGDGLVFIVGLPRSGTTLLERLLIQRTGARSAGELMDFGQLLGHASAQRMASHPELGSAEASLRIDFAALGREYERGAREAVDQHPLLIDKMPVNYLYCGMIATALPRARIIHLVRDPLDTCYAMYKTLFYNAYSFSYTQQELAAYYLAYHRTMMHWHAMLPGRILDVRYEELVADTEAQLQRVLDGCGLAAQAQPSDVEQVAFVTASAAQVRGQIHQRSVHSSRRHLQALAPLANALHVGGIFVEGYTPLAD